MTHKTDTTPIEITERVTIREDLDALQIRHVFTVEGKEYDALWHHEYPYHAMTEIKQAREASLRFMCRLAGENSEAKIITPDVTGA